MLSDRMLISSENSAPEDYQIIGNPHVDGTKYITGLVGCRDNVHTEIFCKKRWIPLPVTADTLAVFPAYKMTSFGNILATRHRVLLRNHPGNESTVKINITLSLSIVDRPTAVRSGPGRIGAGAMASRRWLARGRYCARPS